MAHEFPWRLPVAGQVGGSPANHRALATGPVSVTPSLRYHRRCLNLEHPWAPSCSGRLCCSAAPHTDRFGCGLTCPLSPSLRSLAGPGPVTSPWPDLCLPRPFLQCPPPCAAPSLESHHFWNIFLALIVSFTAPVPRSPSILRPTLSCFHRAV
jgi:hypothetical protein